MNTDYLKTLVATAKSAEGLYEQQAAAMVFTGEGVALQFVPEIWTEEV